MLAWPPMQGRRPVLLTLANLNPTLTLSSGSPSSIF